MPSSPPSLVPRGREQSSLLRDETKPAVAAGSPLTALQGSAQSQPLVKFLSGHLASARSPEGAELNAQLGRGQAGTRLAPALPPAHMGRAVRGGRGATGLAGAAQGESGHAAEVAGSSDKPRIFLELALGLQAASSRKGRRQTLQPRPARGTLSRCPFFR